jgi:hypothetical protein
MPTNSRSVRWLFACVTSDTSIRDTDREAIIRARRGQGLFKQRVMQIERRCRITAVENPIHLVASHCKPWRDSSNEERLNGERGSGGSSGRGEGRADCRGGVVYTDSRC